MYMFFHPFHKAIIHFLCPFVKDKNIVSSIQLGKDKRQGTGCI